MTIHFQSRAAWLKRRLQVSRASYWFQQLALWQPVWENEIGYGQIEIGRDHVLPGSRLSPQAARGHFRHNDTAESNAL